MARLVSNKYVVSFILVTTLFFLWGFARSILDVLNKHFQEMLSVSLTASSLVQGLTYLGYFLTAIPSGLLITRYGYRRGIVGGLLLFGVGALLFIPGEMCMSFQVFLAALFLIGCGLAMLETSANPYVTEMGLQESAAGRLNLAQAFNGLGSILGPVIVGGFLFTQKEAHVALPYSVLGIVVLIVAVAFRFVPLPAIAPTVEKETEIGSEKRNVYAQLLRSKRFVLGFSALFFYEISEISINSLFISYVTADEWITKANAPIVLSFCALGLFMLARIIGSLVMSRVSTSKVLLICAIGAVVTSSLVCCNWGIFSHYTLFGIYLFEAIMFPTIFAMTIIEAGKNVKIASSILMMTPIGGAVGTMLMSLVAEHLSVSLSFIVPAIGFLCVLAFSVYTLKSRKHNEISSQPNN